MFDEYIQTCLFKWHETDYEMPCDKDQILALVIYEGETNPVLKVGVFHEGRFILENDVPARNRTILKWTYQLGLIKNTRTISINDIKGGSL